MAIQRYFLEIAYDGSNYFGWQIQPNRLTVQEQVEGVLSRLHNQPIKVVGCGRTDTGVHAEQYFLHFDAPFCREKLFDSLTLMLPEDIALLGLHEVAPKAHARFDATQRSYSYYLHHRKSIFKRHYSLSTNLHSLDIEKIEAACRIFVQETNYEPLSKNNPSLKHYLSEVSRADFTLNEARDSAAFRVTANRFLHNQIRRMLGVLLNVGNGKISTDELATAMQENQALRYNDTVAAHGLFLHSIKYPYI